MYPNIMDIVDEPEKLERYFREEEERNTAPQQNARASFAEQARLIEMGLDAVNALRCNDRRAAQRLLLQLLTELSS